MKSFFAFWLSALLFLIPELAMAASFEGSLQSLVSAVVGKIMPLCALPFVAKTALGWVRGDAQSVQQLPTVALGVIALHIPGATTRGGQRRPEGSLQ